jgi:predicted DNA-binding transcriptional regulator AlpA
MGKAEKRLLNIREAAEFVGLAEQTLRNRISRNAKYPFPVRPKRIGGKILFDIRDLEKFCNELPHE